MQTSVAESVLRRVYEAFNERDVGALEALFAPDFVDHTPALEQKAGVEGIKEAWVHLHATFPHLYIEIEDLLAHGDKLAARLTFREVSPETRLLTQRGTMMEFVRVEKGRVAELWNLTSLDQVPPGQVLSGVVKP